MKGRASVLGRSGREKADRILGERCPLSSEAGGKEADGWRVKGTPYGHGAWGSSGERMVSMADGGDFSLSKDGPAARPWSAGCLHCGLLQVHLDFGPNLCSSWGSLDQ